MSSSENVGENNGNLLPEEIITEILTRLPAKDVCRSKCVAKRWNSMISQPSFIKSYISRANPPWFILDRTIQITGTESGSDVVGSGSSSTADELAAMIKLELSPRPGISTLTINPYLMAKNRTVLREKPGKIIGSSNGLVLCHFEVERKLPFRTILVHKDSFLFVSNPVTGEWARLTIIGFHMVHNFGFIARVDPENGSLDKFLVIEYQHMVETNTAMLQCFSSDTGKWVAKEADYILAAHVNQREFTPYYGFEFDGSFFWVEYSLGLITWDVVDDIFAEAETDERAKCRLIPLPAGQETPKTTAEIVARRSFGGVTSGMLQYLELFWEGDCWFKCWRLEDYKKKNPVSEWSLLYTLSRLDVPNDNFGFDDDDVDFNEMRILSSRPPYDDPADSVVLCAVTRVFSFNFRTEMVQGAFAYLNHMMLDCIPLVLPRWPISIPPRLYAMYAKEEGNGYLRQQKYKEAIESYSKSIDLFPSAVSPVTYINRAKAYFKVCSFFEAEVDCTRALEIGGSCFQGHALRAIVREDLGFIKGCKEDVAVALTLMPFQSNSPTISSDHHLLKANVTAGRI